MRLQGKGRRRQLKYEMVLNLAVTPDILSTIDRSAQDRLDRWISILSPDWHECVSCDRDRDDILSGPLGYYLVWLISCAHIVVQNSGYPLFDDIRIVRYDDRVADLSSCKVEVIAPRLTSSGMKALNLSLNISKNILDRLTDIDPTPENRVNVFRYIEKETKSRIAGLTRTPQSLAGILRKAYDRGSPFRHIGSGYYQVGWGAQLQYVNGASTSGDSVIGMRLACNKALTTRHLREAGLPMPRHDVVGKSHDALKSADRLGWPVVVKPMDSDGGRAVRVVEASAQVESAFDVARKASATSRVLVEQWHPGICYRLLVAGGRVIYVVRRTPVGVTTDGRTTIHDLVSGEYARQRVLPHWQRSELPPFDPLAEETVEAAGYTKDSVPEAGTFIPLRPRESLEWGGGTEDVTAEAHPENIRIALRAAELLSLRTAGVDIITTDISRPWFDTGAVINEVNYLPTLGISQCSREYLTKDWETIYGKTDRIPVEVYLGGDAAWQRAQARHGELCRQGISAYLTNHRVTLGPDEGPVAFAVDGVLDRLNALVMHRDAEAIVVSMQTDELNRRLPTIEGIDMFHVVDDRIIPTGHDPVRFADLRETLDAWIWPSALPDHEPVAPVSVHESA